MRHLCAAIAAQASTMGRRVPATRAASFGASASRTCWDCTLGASSRNNATRPVTCAAANEDPETKPHCLPGIEVGMSRPGASMIAKDASCPSTSATASTPRCDAGKLALPALGSTAATTITPRDDATSSKRSSNRSRGPPTLRLMISDPLVERELKCLRERESAANGCRGAPLRLPARAQRQQCRVGGNAGDPDAVVSARADHAGHRSSVEFGDVHAAVDEIARHRNASREVGMIESRRPYR